MSGEPKDFVVYDMPGMLGRHVTRPDPNDETKRVRDESWYQSVRQKMATLFAFFAEHGLLQSPKGLSNIDQIILRMSDFSDLGRQFLMTGAPEKWLASFDRPGSEKKITDVSYLDKQLKRLAGARRV